MLVKDQFMMHTRLSAYLLQIVHLTTQRNEKNRNATEKSSSFLKKLVLLHNADDDKEAQRKGKSYSTTFDLCLIIERLADWQTETFERAQRKDHFSRGEKKKTTTTTRQ